MTTGLATTPSYFRGQTLRFQTTFLDFDGNPVNPPMANLWVLYSSPTQDDVEQTIPMVFGGSPPNTWVAYLDTRNFAPGKVQWSINTPAPIQPVTAVDGVFLLTANQANQPTF